MGGNDPFGGTGCEIYDTGAGQWTVAPSMNTSRHSHTCTRLASGDIIVAGGYSFTSSVEVFDAGTRTWSMIGNLPHALDNLASALLPDGRVIFTGGNLWSGVHYQYSDVTFYNPATGQLTSGPSMLKERTSHRLVVTPSGKVLAVSGGAGPELDPIKDCEIFDPSTAEWSIAPPLNEGRRHFEAIQTGSRVFCIGGIGENGVLTSIESLDLSDM
jgi:hypothetical protein